MDHVDAVARELRLGHIDFGLDDRLDAEGQVGHGDLFLDPVVDAVDGAVVVAGEVQNGLAHGLGGDGAGVDADAANDGAGLDHGHALVHLGGGHGGPLPGGSGADDDQVILDGAHEGVSPRCSVQVLAAAAHRRGRRRHGENLKPRLPQRQRLVDGAGREFSGVNGACRKGDPERGERR